MRPVRDEDQALGGANSQNLELPLENGATLLMKDLRAGVMISDRLMWGQFSMTRRLMQSAPALMAGLILTSSALAASPPPSVLAIMGATVFDGTGAPPTKANVIVRNGRIEAVGPKVRVPAGAMIIKAQGEALLPGFYDLHTHWTPAGAPSTTPQIASAYVSSGVTTVNDFNASPESFAPRRAWLAGLVAPHVNFAARVSTPGGHGADWADTATTKWVNTPDAASLAIESLVPYHPDLIKAFTDGWRYGMAPDNTSMDAWTLSALVEAAHKNHLKVFTHTVSADRGAVAGQAKVDVITHSLQDRLLDAKTLAAIKAGGTSITPTLAVYEPVKPGQAARDASDPRYAQTFQKFDYALANAKALHDAGVTIGLGTDAGMPGTQHGTSTLHEMELLVRAGLTPTEALVAGTSASARLMDQISDRGIIAAGKRADLVLIKGEPWKDIADVRKIDRVLIDGKLVFGPGAPEMSANAAKTLPALVLKTALVDDFERPDGRTQLDTLRTDEFDGGSDRTVEVSQTFARPSGGHALSIAAKLSVKTAPVAGASFPLSRGGIQPMDIRAFTGLQFEVRGDGSYNLGFEGTGGRWTQAFSAGSDWRTVRVPFSVLTGRAPWTGDDLTSLQFTASGQAGKKIWLEIDNVTFY